jgi:PIN domain nuclease of toxin-antitoxin system
MSAVIDASALIAFLRDEPGAGAVENVLGLPQTCYAHALNLCEVYYDFWRASDQNAAEPAITDLMRLGIRERIDMDSEFWRDVGGLKAVHRRVSLFLRPAYVKSNSFADANFARPRQANRLPHRTKTRTSYRTAAAAPWRTMR